LTPVFYPKAFVPPALRWLVDLNPLYHLIAPFQFLIHGQDLRQFGISLMVAAGNAAALWCLAAWIWIRRRNTVLFYV
jgi:ABC-type polysaccharide/polyol phosphate export permease